MATTYSEIPRNFKKVAEAVVTDKDKIIKHILLGERIYFYDACAFRYHSKLDNSESIITYLKNSKGVVVITRCVLMELASRTNTLNFECVEYINRLARADICVAILYEEDIYELMKMCFSSTSKICNCLSWAVKCVKTRVSTIEETLNSDKMLFEEIMDGVGSDKKTYKRFFRAVRDNKTQGDNLGEELLAICLHVISNLPENAANKYFVMTDDRGAIGLIKKTKANVIRHLGYCNFSVMTTAKLAQELYDCEIIDEKEQIESILELVAQNDKLKTVCAERYDLDVCEKVFSVADLATHIMTPHSIRVYY